LTARAAALNVVVSASGRIDLRLPVDARRCNKLLFLRYFFPTAH
jgi:hypothetical protein